MREALKLVKETDELVIIKNMCRSNASAAMHPWLSPDIDLITVTKGEQHTLVAFCDKKNTWSFDWGSINDDSFRLDWRKKLLKQNVIRFLLIEHAIPLGCTSKPASYNIHGYQPNARRIVTVKADDGSIDEAYLTKQEADAYIKKLKQLHGPLKYIF